MNSAWSNSFHIWPGIQLRSVQLYHIDSEKGSELKSNQVVVFANDFISFLVSSCTRERVGVGVKAPVTGLCYTPAKYVTERLIYEYEIYMSTNGKDWIGPVTEGEFSNIQNNPVPQFIRLDEPQNARYIKLVSKSSVGESGIVSVAEFDIFVTN